MKKIFLIILIIFTISCGSNSSNNTYFQINGFESYYNQFVSVTNRGSNNIIIQFGSPEALTNSVDVIGLCEVSYINLPYLSQTVYINVVTIDQVWWSNASEPDRQELIDHELGHCILGRGHRNDFLPNGNPASIMNAYHFNPSIIEANPSYYYEELVNGYY